MDVCTLCRERVHRPTSRWISHSLGNNKDSPLLLSLFRKQANEGSILASRLTKRLRGEQFADTAQGNAANLPLWATTSTIRRKISSPRFVISAGATSLFTTVGSRNRPCFHGYLANYGGHKTKGSRVSKDQPVFFFFFLSFVFFVDVSYIRGRTGGNF